MVDYKVMTSNSIFTSTGSGSYKNFLKNSFFVFWQRITALPKIYNNNLYNKTIQTKKYIVASYI